MAALGRRHASRIFSPFPLSFLCEQRRVPHKPLTPIRLCWSSSSGTWRPVRVGNLFTLMLKEFELECGWSPTPHVYGDKKHWLVGMDIYELEFLTEESLLDFYVKTLAAVVGSEEKARKQIYLVSSASYFGFGAEIDEGTKSKLEAQPDVAVVTEHCFYDARNEDPSVRPVVQFTPIYRYHRLNDIFSYHHRSVRNPEWDHDHWLVVLKHPDVEFGSEQETVDFCIRVLAKVFPSEKEAKAKIYIVWCKAPFGFAAEIDTETINKLKAMPDVLKILQDCAFDVKNKDHGVLVIPPSYDVEVNLGKYFYYSAERLISGYAGDCKKSPVLKQNAKT